MIKKITLIVVLIIMAGFYAKAQKITWGAKLSAGFAYQTIKNTDILSTSLIKTLNFRGIGQMPVSTNFWLEGGLGIVGKGSAVNYEALTITTHLTYVEVPLNLLRKFTFTDLGVFYVGAGGYVGMGIGGSLDYETPGSNTSDKIQFGKDDDVTKFDAGLSFTTGFEFRNHVTFNLGYSLGLNNIASTTQQDSGTSVVKNREFLVGLGYLFK
jgi:hypothetical protein